MSAYRLEQVRYSYDGVNDALAVPALEIAAGAVTAFCGANGSGKSTLLQLLAFLELPTAGTLCHAGQTVSERRLPQLRRQASLLLQNPYLFRGSVLDNVEWGLKMRGRGAGSRRRMALQMLEQLGLEGFGPRPARELSGGERQRVALARLLVLRLPVVCLDEPTNHLDRDGRDLVEQALQSWQRENGTTVVVATHDTAFASRLGATRWRLEGGRLCAPEPDNLLPGEAYPGEPTLFQTAGPSLRVHALPPGTRSVRIGPREILLAGEVLPSSARNQLAGVIRSCAPLEADELLVTLDCGVSLQAIVTRDAWQSLGLREGGPAVAAFKASAVVPGE